MIETYIRTVVRRDTVEAIVGMEHRTGDDVEMLRAAIRAICMDVTCRPDINDTTAAIEIGERLKAVWPDRAWFVEVDAKGDGLDWTQVFAPWGLPRKEQP